MRADSDHLSVILLNLVSNAIKYNRRGGRVCIEGRIRADGSVEASVVDTGLGIAPDSIDRLFTPFDRLGAEATSVPGTGLGLALTKQSVEALGGKISVESESGIGSTFTVVFPGIDATFEPATAAGEPSDLRAVAAAPRHLLYVEDDPSTQDILVRMVGRRQDLRLELAGSLQEARARIRERVPDLVLLDLNLAGEDGEAMLNDLRNNATTSAIPVLVISGDDSDERRRRALARGACGYHAKPVHYPALFVDINRMLKPTRAGA